MSKLHKLKEWLTVPDAARHLSKSLGEEVPEADVLRLALEGHVKLSLFLVNAVQALSVILPPSIEEETEAQRQIRDYFMREGDLVRGIWDLVMLGAERSYVEAIFIRLINGVVVEPDTGTTWLSHQDGSVCVLEPAPGFPEGSLLVVRTTELEKRFSSLDPKQQTEVAITGAENAALRKRIEAVLDYARNRFPKGTAQAKMTKHIIKQHKNRDFSESALRQILGGRYPPMKRLNLDGLG